MSGAWRPSSWEMGLPRRSAEVSWLAMGGDADVQSVTSRTRMIWRVRPKAHFAGWLAAARFCEGLLTSPQPAPQV